MANYNVTVTDEGAALLADVLATQGTLTVTEARLSDTNYVGQESTLTIGTFGGVFLTGTTSAYTPIFDPTPTIIIRADFNGSTLAEPHEIYSLGIIATDGNTTALLAVCTTSNPDTIEPAVGTAHPSTYAFNINLAVSSTENITVVGTTAAVLYDTDIVDNLTSTATNKPLSANQGRLISSVLSNENLLVNPFFTINERAKSIYDAVGFTVDAWFANTIDPTGHNLVVGGVTIQNLKGFFLQPISNDAVNIQASKKYTLSAYIDGQLYVSTITGYGDGSAHTTHKTTTDGILLSIIENWTSGVHLIGIYNDNATTNHTLGGIKFEDGEISTLPNDNIPNRAIELAKCRARESISPFIDTYANKGNLVNYADMTNIYVTGTKNTTGATIYAGTYFYLNGQYCIAIANIANNADFTENTNYKVTTVGKWVNVKNACSWDGAAYLSDYTAYDDGNNYWVFIIIHAASPYLTSFEKIVTFPKSLKTRVCKDVFADNGSGIPISSSVGRVLGESNYLKAYAPTGDYYIASIIVPHQ